MCPARESASHEDRTKKSPARSAAIYGRISTGKEQQPHGLATQIHACRQLLERLGVPLREQDQLRQRARRAARGLRLRAVPAPAAAGRAFCRLDFSSAASRGAKVSLLAASCRPHN